MSVVRYLLDEHIDPALRAQLLQYEPEMVGWMIGDPGAPRRHLTTAIQHAILKCQKGIPS